MAVSDMVLNTSDEEQPLTAEATPAKRSVVKVTVVALLLSAGCILSFTASQRGWSAPLVGSITDAEQLDAAYNPQCFLSSPYTGCECAQHGIGGLLNGCGCKCPDATRSCNCPTNSALDESGQWNCHDNHEANVGMTYCMLHKGASCFPGNATVTVEGRGSVAMSSVNTGDSVLVQRQGAELVFEPVLGFLHKLQYSSQESRQLLNVAVSHATGEFQASAGHLVFLADGGDKQASALRVGDRILVAEDGVASPREVFNVRPVVAGADAYAPLTASGTVIVNGVVASNYAAPYGSRLAHAVAHAMLFPVRVYHVSGLALMTFRGAGAKTSSEELHPFLNVLTNILHLDSLHAFLMTSA